MLKGPEGAGPKLTEWLRWFSDIDTIRREAVGHSSSWRRCNRTRQRSAFKARYCIAEEINTRESSVSRSDQLESSKRGCPEKRGGEGRLFHAKAFVSLLLLIGESQTQRSVANPFADR